MPPRLPHSSMTGPPDNRPPEHAGRFALAAGSSDSAVQIPSNQTSSDPALPQLVLLIGTGPVVPHRAAPALTRFQTPAARSQRACGGAPRLPQRRTPPVDTHVAAAPPRPRHELQCVHVIHCPCRKRQAACAPGRRRQCAVVPAGEP